MTERKPPGMRWESWIDRQIREAAERGDFDDLPGRGKPIEGLDEPYDELWWVKRKLRRENLSCLPPTLALRKDVQDFLDHLADQPSEAAVRDHTSALNRSIVKVTAAPAAGPALRLGILDANDVVQRWHELRSRRKRA